MKRWNAWGAVWALSLSACSGAASGLSDEILAGSGQLPPNETDQQKRNDDRSSLPGESTPSPGQGSEPSVPGPPSPIPTPMPSPPANEPLSAISPFHPSGSLTFQRPIDWTISALDPSTVIRYTLDGSTPTASSSSATGKVTLTDLKNGTKIRWTAGSSTIVHALDVGVNDSLKNQTHWLIERVRFDASGGPIVKVGKGARVTGRATAAVWNGYNNCPDCIDQVTVGIVSAADCIISTNPRTYPGSSGNDIDFDLVVPQMAGTYKLRAGFTQQYNCKPDAIGTSLASTEVGTIVVE